MTDWQQLEGRYFLSTGKRQPVTLVRGEGVRVWDDQGREYLDFVAGIAVVSLGHCHPVVVSAITEQASLLMQVSNLVYTVPQVRLAELLVENSCLDRVYFCNSGAEAIEGAIKLARKWGKEKRDGAYEVICTENAFHGRTLATLTASGTEKYKLPYVPLPPGFVHVPYDDIEAARKATSAKTCAIMVEPIQGEGGVNVPSEDYLRELRAWCDEAGILLILDEIQTGIGRTGSLFAYQQYGAEPDIMTLAKGLAGGVPIGALLAKEHCAVFTPGDHGSTFGGNPLCTHVGYSVLKYVIDNDIPGQVAKKGQLLERRLRSLADRHPIVTEVRGRGLLWAIELDGELAERAVGMCLEEGLIANNVKPTALRLMPPLVVSEEELDRAVEIVDRVLAKLEERERERNG
jgi:acetylornithine/N-succinyldiaminopimelate aminotransferase